jgi:hypothetical protein
MLDDFPTGFEKGARETIRPRRFVPRHVIDGILDFLFCKRFIKR